MDAYRFYLCEEHIPIFRLRILQILFCVTVIIIIIMISPLLGTISPYNYYNNNSRCNYNKYFMNNIECYTDGLLIIYIMICISIIAVLCIRSMCNYHQYIIDHKHELDETTILIGKK